MRVVISLGGDNALTFMRRAGYGYQKEGSGEVAFTRRMGASPFPRYHAYVSEADSRKPIAGSQQRELMINLHIDQKEPTYGGNRAHSGEYNGPVIQQECDRLRAFAQSLAAPPASTPKPTEEKKGFLGRLFG